MKKIMILIMILMTTVFSQSVDCNNAETTYDRIDCQKKQMDQADEQLMQYWGTSIKRYKNDKDVLSLMKKSQSVWIKYRKTHCDVLYQLSIGGTIAGLEYGRCYLDLTEKRTHEIWDTYLTYWDSTPPILNEPK